MIDSGYTLKVWVNELGEINAEIFDRAEMFESPRQAILRQVLKTQDLQVREALIKLGWTPPPNSRESDSPPP